jgi:hypothetical protein
LSLLISEDNELLLPMLYALVAGLVALALLLLFSSPDKPPKWHKGLCAVGFVVAIGWISTIADEVVGVLRAFGAIVGVSEAILGVTVFAMVYPLPSFSRQGNSLSDFVADVTVARMGYPMMAMSACFGGPMLSTLHLNSNCRYPSWGRRFRTYSQPDILGGSIQSHHLTNPSRLHNLVIPGTNEYVDSRPTKQMAHDPHIRDQFSSLLHIKYSSKRTSRNIFLDDTRKDLYMDRVNLKEYIFQCYLAMKIIDLLQRKRKLHQ